MRLKPTTYIYYYLLTYWLLRDAFVDAAAGTPNCRHGGGTSVQTSDACNPSSIPTTHTHNLGEKACDQTSRPGVSRPYMTCYPVWQPTLHATSENTATAPGNLLTIQTSYLQACLPSLRPSPRPLREDRRNYRGREYNTGGRSEGGKVVPPGITTSDRGGSSQTRNGPVVFTHQQHRQRCGASFEVTLSELMSRHPNKC